MAPRAYGAFRHDDFVITVHGVRLEPNMFVQATYDLDPESQWPLNWADGMDFYTFLDGQLFEYLQDGTFFPVNTGVVARLWGSGNGFSYSVPLSAMHDPTGPITFAIIVASYGSGYGTDPPADRPYYFRAFGRAECRKCTRVAAQR